MDNQKTKNCKYCKSVIDKKAKVCPVCNKKLKHPGRVMGIVLIVLVGAAIIFTIKSQPPTNIPTSASSTTSYITLQKFYDIKTGMSYDEVKDIIGSPGKIMSESEIAGHKTVIIMWEGKGSIGANANITFQDGKVAIKAQAGLK